MTISTSRVTFTVVGTPIPQGSTRAFVVAGRAVTTAANPRTRSWRHAVAACAAEARPEVWPMRAPVMVEARFLFTRPSGHHGKRGLRPSAPAFKVTAPDLDKLLRATLDALTGVLFVDDRQVVAVRAGKEYAADGQEARAAVIVTALETLEAPR